MITKTLAQFEATITGAAAQIGAYAAPLPSAYFVYRACVGALALPSWAALAAAMVVELLGLAATGCALELWQYNQVKRKADPAAPVKLAVSLVGVYFGAVTLLVVLLEVVPWLAVIAPLVFPVLSLAGVGVLALRAQHTQRLAAIDADRQAARQARADKVSSKVSDNEKNKSFADKMQDGKDAKKRQKIDTLLDIFRSDSLTPISDAARRAGMSRETVYNYLHELETAGIVHKNGNGVEVLQ